MLDSIYKPKQAFPLADPENLHSNEPDDGPGKNMLAGKMLQLLVCPLTKQSLKFDKDRQELVSLSARLAYPIRGGVPIMLPSEARALNDEDMKKKR